MQQQGFLIRSKCYATAVLKISLFGALGSRPTITPHPHCYSGVFGATMPTFVFVPPMRTRQNSVLVTTRLYLPEVHSPAVYDPST
jgi:hypothetical protein